MGPLVRLSAPGKVFLLGEYAVLGGGVGIVAAVNRRAHLRAGPRMPRGPVVAEVVRGLAALGKTLPPCDVDTSGMREGGRKLGLGSSALAALLTASFGLDRRDESALSLAVTAHRASQEGKGSGLDVAAAFHGGVIAGLRQPGAVESLPRRIRGLRWYLFATDKAASTGALIKACVEDADSAEMLKVMVRLSKEGADAYRRQDARGFMGVVAQYHRAMAALGRASGVSLVEPSERFVRAAEALGGTGKPSGAGGGDLTVVFVPEDCDRRALEAQAGAKILPLEVDPRGLVRESSS